MHIQGEGGRQQAASGAVASKGHVWNFTSTHTDTHMYRHTSSCNCDEQQQQQPMANARRRVQAWRALNRYYPLSLSLSLCLSPSIVSCKQRRFLRLQKLNNTAINVLCLLALDRFVQLTLLKANANIQRQQQKKKKKQIVCCRS